MFEDTRQLKKLNTYLERHSLTVSIEYINTDDPMTLANAHLNETSSGVHCIHDANTTDRRDQTHPIIRPPATQSHADDS